MSNEKINVQEQQNDEGVHSENPNKSSELLQQERGNIANALQNTELTSEDIQKSIKVGDEAEKAQEITKSVISMASSNELYNSTFINLHGGGLRNQLQGAYKAYDLLKDKPEDKVVLYDILGGPRFFYRIGYDSYNIRGLLALKKCLEKPNCVLTDLFEINDVKFGQGYNKEFYERLSEAVQSQKYAFIDIVRHDIRHKCAINAEELIKNKELISESYNTYNLHYGPCTFEEFVNIIIDSVGRKKGVDVMKGEKLVGIYCDIDDTLIIRDKDGFVVNEKVLNYLKEQEKQGREIHIWTGGNISDQQEKLNKFGIKYPLISKYEHRGAEAEIVIDDQDYSSFMSDYGIKAKNYINVHDL